MLNNFIHCEHARAHTLGISLIMMLFRVQGRCDYNGVLFYSLQPVSYVVSFVAVPDRSSDSPWLSHWVRRLWSESVPKRLLCYTDNAFVCCVFQRLVGRSTLRLPVLLYFRTYLATFNSSSFSPFLFMTFYSFIYTGHVTNASIANSVSNQELFFRTCIILLYFVFNFYCHSQSLTTNIQQHLYCKVLF